jgi:hypothetical protein
MHFIPGTRHMASPFTAASRLMPFGEIVSVYSENRADHVNALRGQNAMRLYIKAGDTLCTGLISVVVSYCCYVVCGMSVAMLPLLYNGMLLQNRVP